MRCSSCTRDANHVRYSYGPSTITTKTGPAVYHILVSVQPLLLVVHLSDMHIREGRQNPVLSRAERLAEAISSVELDRPREILVVFSGDVAFAGTLNEYTQAETWLTRVIALLKAKVSEVVKLVVIPGNHDCDFSYDDADVRKDVLEGILGDRNFTSGRIAALTRIQQEFFAFRERMTGFALPVKTETLRQTFDLNFSCGPIRIEAFNTAAMSILHENPGSLHVLVPGPDEVPAHATFSIATFHHGPGWIEPNNQLDFQNWLERNVDLTLSGHDHRMHTSSVQSANGALEVSRAAALQDNTTPGVSGFTVYAIDFESDQRSVHRFRFRKDMYRSEPPSEWQSLSTHSSRRNQVFHFAKEHRDFLFTTEYEFSSNKRKFNLQDLYVLPRLNRISTQELFKHLDRQLGSSSKKVLPENLIEFVLAERRVIIHGAVRSGKTALTKNLQTELQKKGITAVRIDLVQDGSILKSLKVGNVKTTVEKLALKQFEAFDKDQYEQLSREKRAFIIDNAHVNTLDRKQHNLLIERLCEMGDCVVLLNGNDAMTEEVAVKTHFKAQRGFERCQILPLTYNQRRELIERWVTTADPYTSPLDLTSAIEQRQMFVDRMLGAGLIGSTPFEVLMVLQEVEANFGIDFTTVAFANFADEQIKSLVNRISIENGIEPDTSTIVLERVANAMFSDLVGHLSLTALERHIRDYSTEVDISVPSQTLITALQRVGLLRVGQRGDFEFSYPFQYHYFVASGLSRRLADLRTADDVLKTIQDLAKNLHVENNANITIMTGHLSKSSAIMDIVLGHAKSMFSEVPVCDFDQTTKFVEHLQLEIPKIVLRLSGSNQRVLVKSEADTDPLTALEETSNHTVLRDHSTDPDDLAHTSVDPEVMDDADSELDQQLRQIVKINAAFKTVEALGQMLRSFAAGSHGETKIEVAKVTYDLSMRTLGVLLALFEGDLEGVVATVRKLMTERTASSMLEAEEVERRSRLLVFQLIVLIAYSSVQRVAVAVGSTVLRNTFSHLSTGGGLAYRIIDFALDTTVFGKLDPNIVAAFMEETESRRVAKHVIIQLVMRYLFLFQHRQGLVQKLSHIMDIEIVQMERESWKGRDDKLPPKLG
jgi:molybdopterin-guanine dinucleotide biosynthesis protein